MKKYTVAVVMIAALTAPAFSYATSFSTGDELSLGVSQRVAGDWYVAAGTAALGGSVGGDLVVAGGTVTVTGAVGEDVIAAGGTIQLLGPVAGDIRATGGSLTIGGAVGGDLVVAGGTVHVLPDARIDGGLYIAGGTVTMDGLVAGDAKVTAGTLTVSGAIGGTLTARIGDTLTIASGGTVAGDVVYSAPRRMSLASDASVAGEVKYTPRVRGFGRHDAQNVLSTAAWALAAALTALETIVMLGAAALVVWRWRREGSALLQDAVSPFWRHAGWGLLVLVAVPLAAAFLAATVIGIIPALLLMLVYAMLGIVAKVLSAVMLGSLLERAARKQPVLHVTWLNALGGVVLLQILTLIPFIGWLVKALFFLAVFGVLSRRAKALVA